MKYEFQAPVEPGKDEAFAADNAAATLSEYAASPSSVRAREAGFDYHLTKPVDHTELDVLLSMEAATQAAAPPQVRH